MVRQTSNNSIVSNTTIEGSTEPLMPDSPDPEIQIRIKASSTIGKLLNNNNKGVNTSDPIDLIDKSDSSTIALGTTIAGVLNPESSKQCGEENMVLASTATGNGTIAPDTSEVGLHNKDNKLQYVEHSPISPSTCLVAECNLHLGEIIADKSSRLTGQKWPNYFNSRCNTTYVSTTTTTISATTSMTSSSNTSITYSQPQQLIQQQLNTVQSSVAEGNVSVQQMLLQISQQVAAGNQQTAGLRKEIQGFNDTIQHIYSEIGDNERRISNAITSHNKCCEQVDLLTKTVISQERQISELNNKIENIQLEKTKNNLMIWGVDETEGEEDVGETFKDFVKLKLEITSTVPVNKVQRRGKKSPRMLWVELANNDDKYLIFKHLKNLKGKKNMQGFGYSIREDLPESMQEQDKRYRSIMHANKIKTVGQMNMIVKNKKLLINNQVYRKSVPAPWREENQVYRKSVPAPTREELLNPEEREYIQSANLVMSGEKREKGNVFIAYAANIANVQQARAIYRHIKTKHIDSTHVVRVHCLEGEMPTLKDF